MQIGHQSVDRKNIISGTDRMFLLKQQVDHRQKGIRIDPTLFTNLSYGFVSEAQRNTETTHYKQNRIIRTYQIAHTIVSIVFSQSVHKSPLNV